MFHILFKQKLFINLYKNVLIVTINKVEMENNFLKLEKGISKNLLTSINLFLFIQYKFITILLSLIFTLVTNLILL